MPYDPFHLATDQDDASESSSKKLVSVRRPPICDVKLIPLEWNANDSAPRKRSRTDGVTNSHRSSMRKERKITDDATDGNAKEVVKVVEKVVNAEPVTIMGVAPLVDDRVRYVVNFILEHVNAPYVEVEAKLGTLIEKVQNVRAVDLVPVLCETPIRSESNKDTRFESDVGGEIFSKLNSRLNRRVEETAVQGQGSIRYLRTREMDVFWPGKIRETRELRKAADGTDMYETVRVQSKTRLGDLNVLCPGRTVDIRYSASAERDSTVPQNASPVLQRTKDRISYKFDYLSVDITCVEANTRANVTTTFEVEVEIDSSADLYNEVQKFRRNDETSKLFEIAASMVNTARLLLEP